MWLCDSGNENEFFHLELIDSNAFQALIMI